MIDSLLEKNLLPDWLIRIGIRRLLRQRLREEACRDPVAQLRRFAAELTGQPVPEQVNGLSFLPTLVGDSSAQKQPPYLYWEHPQTKDHDWAVRTGPWKGVFRGWKNNSNKPEI